MTFPGDPLGVRVELNIGGTWTDITADVLLDPPIEITRGRPDEAAQADPATCRMRLRNTGGKYSPRNPRSPYYGLIGRNTPLRVSIVYGEQTYRRFVGEVSSWPPRWAPSGHRQWVDIEATGILHRLRQGRKPLKSALRRKIEGTARYTAWWPLEDSEGATQAVPGYPGLTPLRVSGDVTFGAAEIGGIAGGVSLGEDGRLMPAPVPGGSSAGWVVAGWYAPPPASEWEELHASPLIQWQTTGSASLWFVAAAYDGVGVSLMCEVADQTIFLGGGSGPAPAITSGSGLPVQVLCRAVQSGSDVVVTIQADGVTVVSFTLTSHTCGRVSQIGINDQVVEDHGLTFLGSWSHLLVAPSSRYSDVIGLIDAGQGYAGEAALDRAARIAAEEGIPLLTVGADSQRVGPQRAAAALDLIVEAVDADLGMLYEQRDAPALVARARSADYNTAPALTLSYRELAPPLEPVDDDQRLRNDITVERIGGSSARAIHETGPLSVQPPPDGAGRYDTAVTLNVASDDQLLDIATWLLHLGIWDEARYPVVRLDLADDPHLIPGVLATDIRSRITIDDLPDWLPPGPVDLLVEGYTERLGVRTWEIEYTCSPGGPWQIALVEDETYGRVDTDGSELAAAVTATATALTVATTAGPVWTTDPADLPFDVIVGGEVMTVTAITGTSSPQTFTVVRAVNGITKPHAAGADVRLAHPAIVAL